MSLLTEKTSTVILDFRLPPEFRAPVDGDHQTIVSVKAVNSKFPIDIPDWRRTSIFDAGWKYDFPHHYSDVGVKYQVNVQLLHNQQSLLIQQDYFVIISKAPHRQTLHLSPIGFLYVETQEPETVPPEEAVTILLHESQAPEVELLRIKHDEQTATGFYLQYDPNSVIPGRDYTLSGIENRYHQPIQVSPGHVELSPVSRNPSSRLFHTFMRRLQSPLRLFTDSAAKIR